MLRNRLSAGVKTSPRPHTAPAPWPTWRLKSLISAPRNSRISFCSWRNTKTSWPINPEACSRTDACCHGSKGAFVSRLLFSDLIWCWNNSDLSASSGRHHHHITLSCKCRGNISYRLTLKLMESLLRDSSFFFFFAFVFFFFLIFFV